MSNKDQATEEQAVRNLTNTLELSYQEKGTRFLYSDEEIVFQAAAWLGNKPILEDLLHLKKTRQINLNLSFHGAEALSRLIKTISVTGLLPDEVSLVGTQETIEIIQLLITHGVRAKDEHLKEAVSGKNLELVQYLITQLGLDAGIAIRTRVPGTEEIREWAKEWKKVSKLKSKLSSSLNKESSQTNPTRSKI